MKPARRLFSVAALLLVGALLPSIGLAQVSTPSRAKPISEHFRLMPVPATLEASGQPGDFAVDDNSGELYVYTGNGKVPHSWMVVGSGGGGSGNVTADDDFGTVGYIIVADSTGRNVKSVPVVIDDAGNITGIASLAVDTFEFTNLVGTVPEANIASTIARDTEVAALFSDTAFAGSWNGVTTIAPSKNAIHDWGSTFDTDFDGKPDLIDSAAGSSTLGAAGAISVNTTNLQVGIHNGTKEVAIPLVQRFAITFDPKAVCDGAVDRLFLMRVGDWAPFGITIRKWYVSFEADPTTEADLDLKRADAFIGVANSAVMDVLDTTTGASSETTAANINSGAVVANGKVIYLEFGTAYTETTHQIIVSIEYEIEED
jgi:hypothetical protein